MEQVAEVEGTVEDLQKWLNAREDK